MRESRRFVLFDLLAGLIAIVVVVGTSILTSRVGSDLRALFALTGVMFFLAGVARGRGGVSNLWLKALLVSSPGILGTAAMLANDGLHRLPIPLAVSLTAILLTASGVAAKRLWIPARAKGLLLSAASFALLAPAVLLLVPRIAIYGSLKNLNRLPSSFAISSFDGHILNSSDLRGHVVVLAFWTTWCLPCQWELPELDAVYARFKSDPQVMFFAVNTGWEDTTEKARRYWAARKFTLPGAFDTGGAARALGVDSLPTVVLLDRDGRLRLAHYGYDSSEHVGELISTGVNELTGRAPRN